MSVKYGFYNSINHDRMYDAVDISSMFDGIILDGVFNNYGDKFLVSASGTGLTVNVGTGRAWFNHTWTLNDAILQLTHDAADVTYGRIDAVVLEVNSATTHRVNSIKIIKGTPSSSPLRPSLIKSDIDSLYQYPLAYVTIPRSATTLNSTNISVAVGLSDCPFVTGILQQMNVNSIMNGWVAEFENLLSLLQDELRDVEGGVAFDFKPIRDENIIVSPSDFKTYTTMDDEESRLKYDLYFTYRAAVPVDGVLSEMIPYITLSLPSVDDTGVSIANQFKAYNGGFYIYADAIPNSNIKVLTAEFRRSVNLDPIDPTLYQTKILSSPISGIVSNTVEGALGELVNLSIPYVGDNPPVNPRNNSLWIDTDE